MQDTFFKVADPFFPNVNALSGYCSNTISVLGECCWSTSGSNYVKASRRPLCTHLCDHYALLITLPSLQEEAGGFCRRGHSSTGDGHRPHHKLRLKLRAPSCPSCSKQPTRHAAEDPSNVFWRGQN